MNDAEIDALDELEFPDHLPDGLCKEAIREVTEYLLDHGDARKEDLWSDIVLNTDHSSAGREVCKKWGYVPKYQKYWWETVILPGLRVLSHVEPTNQKETHWRISGEGRRDQNGEH